MVRALLLTSTAALGAAVLAGCGGASPKPAPFSPSAAGSASASVTVAPTMPAEAKGTTPESAKAVVRYFVDALDYAGRTGDTKPMRQVLSTQCACTNIADFVDKTYAAGGSIEGAGWILKSVTALGNRDGALRVNAVVDVSSQVVTASPGTKPQHYDGAPDITKKFWLNAAGNSWQITKLVQDQG